ncbi:hypothetical protein O3M35_001511 [Rhynocoris fuscipes]|uniref:N-acyl-aliphatic-L-amino acid amidohydrolase n=1 Tax=Rhynocoris fuscipes TaxID=488301 RepID=A0AAW1CQA7_9HEMI
MEDQAVKYFREYLRIPSVHPDIDYSKCVEFLKRLAKENGLECNVFGKPGKPIVILTWTGSDRNLGSILLNSHMDVVPVYKERWIYDPFEAVKDDQGNIYGRGAQDTKCTGVQHVAAIRRLMDKGVKLKRTVHVSFVPDEEIGGVEGFGYFVQTDDFRKLNIAFEIDEGCATPNDELAVYNAERTSHKIKIHCKGPTGHGSLLHLNTAGEKVQKVLAAMMDFRQTQVLKMENASDELAQLAEVTSINLTEVEGGIQNNVVPPEIILGFDVRLSVNEDHDKFFEWIENVCKDAGEGVYCEYVVKSPKIPKTILDSSNKFWVAMKNAIDKMNMKVKVISCFGTTDARYLRQIGIDAIGFSPMRLTPILLHADNEMLNERTFLEGIDVYSEVIRAVANV